MFSWLASFFFSPENLTLESCQKEISGKNEKPLNNYNKVLDELKTKTELFQNETEYVVQVATFSNPKKENVISKSQEPTITDFSKYLAEKLEKRRNAIVFS